MGKYFHHSSGKLFYNDHGSGIPVVFIHGYLETSDVWRGFAEELERRFRIITVDLPGHGRSDIFGEVHSMDLMADVLHELLVSLNTGPVFIVGHSMGGYVTMAFVDKFSDMLKGYCLFHSHPFADSPETIAKRKMEITLVRAGNKDNMFPESISRLFARDNLAKFADAVARSEKIAADIPDDGIVAVLKGMMERPSRAGVMEEGKIPCLWILGAHDNHINCEKILERVKLPSNARVEILKNSGHMGFIEEKTLSLGLLVEFISNLS
jgi:pimeloyl-ACP methyl ester carboxylesterase